MHRSLEQNSTVKRSGEAPCREIPANRPILRLRGTPQRGGPERGREGGERLGWPRGERERWIPKCLFSKSYQNGPQMAAVRVLETVKIRGATGSLWGEHEWNACPRCTCIYFIPDLGRQKQVHPCDLGAGQVYLRISRTLPHTKSINK